MMNHILFFGLKEDVLPVLDIVENKGHLKYVRTERGAGDTKGERVTLKGERVQGQRALIGNFGNL